MLEQKVALIHFTISALKWKCILIVDHGKIHKRPLSSQESLEGLPSLGTKSI